MTDRDIISVRDLAEPGKILQYPILGGSESLKRAERYVEDPEAFAPVKPKIAATVMLISKGKAHRSHRMAMGGQSYVNDEVIAEHPVDVFMLKRVSTMAFVPDAVVFPGGGMDDRDVVADIAWEGPLPGEWARLMGCDEATAKGVVVAAARELFEESGVLLAGIDGVPVEWDGGSDHWAADRERVASREISFGELLHEKNFSLRSDCLALHSHWITPPSEPKRYDTYFFTARLPHGQHADGATSEAADSGWIPPVEALRRGDEGRLKLMPPTISNLTSLSAAQSLEEAMERPFNGHVMPVPIRYDNGDMVFSALVRDRMP